MLYQVYKAFIDPNPDDSAEVNFIGLVDRPAIEKNFQAFKAFEQRAKFVLDEERRIISGPAMIADLPIYRNDPQLGEYLVVFDKEAIQAIVQKFNAKGYLKNFNLFHDPQQQVDGVTILNSFISDSTIGISPMKGFEDLAEGSWFLSTKIDNEEVWQKIKAGDVRGYSVEGIFNYVPVAKVQMNNQEKKIAELMEVIAKQNAVICEFLDVIAEMEEKLPA